MYALLIKATTFKHTAGYAKYGNPPRWHKLSADKPSPKGSAVAHHPTAAGQYAPVVLSDDEIKQWMHSEEKAAKNPEMAAHNNKHLPNLLSHAAEGDATAILGMGFGTNTHSKKLVAAANHLLEKMGSPHKVSAGQDTGSHPAVQAPTEQGHVEGDKYVMPLNAAIAERKKLVQAAKTPSKADASAEFAAGDVFQLDSQYQKMNAGQWKVYNVSPDGKLVFMHKVGAKIPNGKNSATIPAATLKEAIQKGTAKKAAQANVNGKLEDTGPKEGETKQGADGTLVFKNGRWHKQVGDKPAGPNMITVPAMTGKTGPTTFPEPPNFKTHEEAMEWIAKRAKELGMSKTSFAASYEYQYALPKMEAVYKVAKAEFDKKQKEKAADILSQMADAGVKFGDTVAWTNIGMFLSQIKYEGVVVSKGGIPYVKLANKVTVSSGGKLKQTNYLPWEPHMLPKHATNQNPVKNETPAAAGVRAPKPAAASEPIKNATSKLDRIPWDSLLLHDGHTSAKTHNAQVAKIKAMAHSGDTAGLEDYIAKKGTPKQTYAKKQKLLAQTALAALKEEGAPAPVIPPASQAHALTSPVTVERYGAAGAKGAISAGVFFAPKGQATSEYGKELHSFEIPAGSMLFNGKSSIAFAQQHGLMDLEDPDVKKITGLSSLSDVLDQQGVMPPQTFHNAFQTVAKRELEKAGYQGAYWSDEDDLNPEQYQIWGVAGAADGPAASTPASPPAAGPSPDIGDLTAEQLGKLQSIPWFKQKLGPEKSNAKSHNIAVDKIEAMAFAGDKAGLQAFIAGKAGAKQYYANKQAVLAQAALAVLQEGEAAAPTPEAKPPANPLAKPKRVVLAKKPASPVPAVAPAAATAPKGAENMKAPKVPAGAPQPPKVTHHWDDIIGSLKNWAATGDLKNLKFYADPKNGWILNGPGGAAVREYAADLLAYVESGAAQPAPAQQKKKIIAAIPAEKVPDEPAKPPAAGQAVDTGPKEGDIKQGADGLLVLKNGHWVRLTKKEKAAALSAWQTAIHKGQVPKKADAMVAESVNQENPERFLDLMYEALPYSLEADDPNFGSHLDRITEKATIAHLLALRTPDRPKAPGPKPVKPTDAPIAMVPGVESMDHWVQTGPQAGSNPGGRFKDADGVEWYCKFPKDDDIAKSEVLAANLYGLAGVTGQDAKLVSKGGKLGVASRWEDVKKASSPAALAAVDGVKSGFAVDAWLGNWDVVGMGLDNLQIGADGNAIRVDAGGSLEYRAQGGKKAFGNVVTEIESLRDPNINPHAAAVFGDMTTADITASVKKVAAVSDDDIYDMVMKHGPGSHEHKAKLIETLIERKKDLLAKYPKAVKKKPTKSKPDPTALKVDASKLPKPHDFKNWNGPGHGLSSQAHVNEMNAKAEQDLFDFAMKGNLVALKDYHYDAVDKSTGASLGKKPINDHPSKHVKEYWSGLVSALNFIAYPPEELKGLKIIVATSVKKVSDFFKAAKYGMTTNKAHASARLAFWIALGQAKKAETLLPPGASLEFQSVPTGIPKMTSEMKAQAKSAYAALSSSRLVKKFINGIQKLGSYNDNFRDGKMVTSDGKDAVGMVLDAYEYATEKPEGFEIYKWVSFSGDMGQQLLNVPPGTVFQNPGSMCCSYEPNATSGFGADRMRIRYAKGAKAVDSFGSGNFSGEKEITTLPGQRFVVLSCKKVMCPVQGEERIELDVLMLPPDPTYVSELEAMKGAHGTVTA